MARNSSYTNEISTLNANIVAIINRLKSHDKRVYIASTLKQLTKRNNMQDLTKGDVLKKVHDLEVERKIVDKHNRKKDSFHVGKDIAAAIAQNILIETPIRFYDRSFLKICLIHLIKNWEVLQYLILVSTIPHVNQDVKNIRETESLINNVFDKLKVNVTKKGVNKQRSYFTKFGDSSLN